VSVRSPATTATFGHRRAETGKTAAIDRILIVPFCGKTWSGSNRSYARGIIVRDEHIGRRFQASESRPPVIPSGFQARVVGEPELIAMGTICARPAIIAKRKTPETSRVRVFHGGAMIR